MKKACLLICVAVFFTVAAHAEKVTLKSGKTIEGAIVEKTDTYIKIKADDISIPLTYYTDDIKSIDDMQAIASPDESTGGIKSEFQRFQLGECKVNDNEIKFDFPMERGSLYAFSMKEWKRQENAPETKLVIALYGKDKKLIEKAESVCVPETMKSYGSLSFETDKKTIDDVSFFTAQIESCVKKKEAGLSGNEGQVVFAQRVVSAIKENKEAFFALYSSRPSEKLSAMEEFMYQSLRGIVDSGGTLGEIIPITGKHAEKFKGLCDQPYSMELSSQTADGARTSLSFPIGPVKGEWKILNVDE